MLKRKLNYKPMPASDGVRTGCKVSWRYYKDRAKAEKAAVIARHNAMIDASLGYDFGYCEPGSIEMAHPNSPHAGMWEVCTS